MQHAPRGGSRAFSGRGMHRTGASSRNGVSTPDGTPPCTAETLFFATYEPDRHNRRVTTVRRHLASIMDGHRRKGLPQPSTKEGRTAVGKFRRERREQPRGKLALEDPDLVRAAEQCDVITNSGTRDRAGFATAPRRSELARVPLDDATFEPKGIRVRIPWSRLTRRALAT